MSVYRMDPDHRAPTLVPAYVLAALILATCAIYATLWF